jgi:long-subunit acyl-CoA synthetase (AMP-forming)
MQGVSAKMPPAKLNLLLSIPILNKIIAKKVLTGLGLDQVKVAASGSAPLPPSLIAWYRRLGLNLLEGYGMTEDMAYSHTMTKTKIKSAMSVFLMRACKRASAKLVKFKSNHLVK